MYDIWVMNHPERDLHPSIQVVNREVNRHREVNTSTKEILCNMLQRFLDTSSKDWVLCLEDDIHLGKNLIPAIDHIMTMQPKANLLRFYDCRKEIYEKPFGLHKVKYFHISFMFCTMISRWLVLRIVNNRYDDDLDNKWNDTYVKEIIRKYKLDYYVTNPSFVQHDINHYKSTVGNDSSSAIVRQSPTFDENRDLLEMVKTWKI